VRRRVLMVGRTRYALPLEQSLARKFDALSDVFDLRVVGAARGRGDRGNRTFSLLRPLPVRALDAPAFYGTLPLRIARELGRFRPDAIVAQSPYEASAALAARALVRSDAAVIVEIHGDWQTWSRLYGSPLRALATPTADRVAPWIVRRADAVRTLSPFTEGLVREAGADPTMSFTTYTELTAFSGPPVVALPPRPTALFVGVLERYKNIDGIVEAWRLAAPRVPGAVLRLVGDGRHRQEVAALVADLPDQTEWVHRLETPDVVRALDDAWCLLLVSRSEGTPRIVLETLCRGRAVIGGHAGGIPDVVRHEETGLLVEPEDRAAIADALVRILSDRPLAERLGAAGHAWSSDWTYTPVEYAARMADLVERAIANRAAA
jgi:glycosyltransferase involved in cell wall biosynthesis